MSSAALTAGRVASATRPRFRRASAMPGFGLAFGYTLLYLGLIVLLPLAALVVRASSLGLAGFWSALSDARVLAALKVSFGLSFAAALVDAVFGLLAAWVLTRYRFPGRKLLDAAIDLPFALPTAVAGIALAALYAPNGWIGSLVAPLGLKSPLRHLVSSWRWSSSACLSQFGPCSHSSPKLTVRLRRLQPPLAPPGRAQCGQRSCPHSCRGY
jgi:sulfate/thiosulfate transport system permease protein